jgi:hypothetical protein
MKVYNTYISTRWSFDPKEMAADGYHPEHPHPG